MTNAATQPNQVFTPRTVTSVERGASALVERFASPLRQIGGRALGFVDRLLGPRLFGLLADPTYREISVGNAPGMVFTVPWYRRSAVGPRHTRPRPPEESAPSLAAAGAEAPAAGEIGPSVADAPSLTLDLFQGATSAPDLAGDGEISPHQPAPAHGLASRAPSTGVHVISGRSVDAAGEIVRGSDARLAERRATEGSERRTSSPGPATSTEASAPHSLVVPVVGTPVAPSASPPLVAALPPGPPVVESSTVFGPVNTNGSSVPAAGALGTDATSGSAAVPSASAPLAVAGVGPSASPTGATTGVSTPAQSTLAPPAAFAPALAGPVSASPSVAIPGADQLSRLLVALEAGLVAPPVSGPPPSATGGGQDPSAAILPVGDVSARPDTRMDLAGAAPLPSVEAMAPAEQRASMIVQGQRTLAPAGLPAALLAEIPFDHAAVARWGAGPARAMARGFAHTEWVDRWLDQVQPGRSVDRGAEPREANLRQSGESPSYVFVTSVQSAAPSRGQGRTAAAADYVFGLQTASSSGGASPERGTVLDSGVEAPVAGAANAVHGSREESRRSLQAPDQLWVRHPDAVAGVAGAGTLPSVRRTDEPATVAGPTMAVSPVVALGAGPSPAAVLDTGAHRPVEVPVDGAEPKGQSPAANVQLSGRSESGPASRPRGLPGGNEIGPAQGAPTPASAVGRRAGAIHSLPGAAGERSERFAASLVGAYAAEDARILPVDPAAYVERRILSGSRSPERGGELLPSSASLSTRPAMPVVEALGAPARGDSRAQGRGSAAMPLGASMGSTPQAFAAAAAPAVAPSLGGVATPEIRDTPVARSAIAPPAGQGRATSEPGLRPAVAAPHSAGDALLALNSIVGASATIALPGSTQAPPSLASNASLPRFDSGIRDAAQTPAGVAAGVQATRKGDFLVPGHRPGVPTDGVGGIASALSTGPSADSPFRNAAARGAMTLLESAALSYGRPGKLGAQAEQMAGVLGVRAAGLSVDFVEPERLAMSLPSRHALAAMLAPGAPESNSRQLLTTLSGGMVMPRLTPDLAAPRALQRPVQPLVGSHDGPAEAMTASIGPHGQPLIPASAGAAPSARSAAASSTPGVAQTANWPASAHSPAADSPATATTAMAATLRHAAGGAEMTTGEVSRRLEALWALVRVFPAALPGALPAAVSDLHAAGLLAANAPARVLLREAIGSAGAADRGLQLQRSTPPSGAVPPDVDVSRAGPGAGVPSVGAAGAFGVASPGGAATAAGVPLRDATVAGNIAYRDGTGHPGFAYRDATGAIRQSMHSLPLFASPLGPFAAASAGSRFAEGPRLTEGMVGASSAAGVRSLVSAAPQGSVGSSRLEVVAPLDRPALPSGRMPRGSYLWSRVSPVHSVGDWSPSANVDSATEAAGAVQAGLPAWEGMPTVAAPGSPGARHGGGEQVQADGVGDDGEGQSDFGPSPHSAGGRRRLEALRGLSGRALPGRNYPLAAPPRSRASASGGEEFGAAADLLSSVEGGRPLLQLVTAAASSAAAATTRPSPESSFSMLMPNPTISASPGSEASARIVDALRRQQDHQAGDDRITLDDLTLVAVASATNQLAASEAGGAGGSTSRPATALSGTAAGSSAKEKKSAEAERREIEELARQVFDEMQRMTEIARERAGDCWDS